MNKELKLAYDYCQKITKENSSTYYNAFKNLNQQDANAIFAIYSWCRIIDDIVDEDQDLNKLKEFETKFNLFLTNPKKVQEPYYLALDDVFKHYKINTEYFKEMIKGQYSDFSHKPFTTKKQLLNYCYLVASTVGLMLEPIIFKKINKDSKEIAINLGIAMQLTNILRDIGIDWNNDRLYIPSYYMKKYNYSKIDLDNQIINKNFILMWEDIASLADKYYEQATKSIDQFKLDAQMPILLSIKYYQSILNVIRKNNYDVFSKKQYVNYRTKLKLYNQAKKQLAK